MRACVGCDMMKSRWKEQKNMEKGRRSEKSARTNKINVGFGSKRSTETI